MMVSSLVLFLIVRYTSILSSWLGDLNDNQIRGLLYMQISISGQATIFITRTTGSKLSFMERPGVLVMLAFVVAQAAATAIGIL